MTAERHAELRAAIREGRYRRSRTPGTYGAAPSVEAARLGDPARGPFTPVERPKARKGRRRS